MKPQRAGLLFASGSALALLLAACSGGSSNSASPQPTSTASQVFTYDTTATVMDDTWDPATEYSDGIIAMPNMYETLTRYNSVTHKVDPLLATSWSKSADGLTWTFHLRHGVHFHTGRLMTAQAAKAALQRTIKLGGGAAYVFIAAMVATSFDRTAAWLGPHKWRLLHLVGSWYIWLSFAVGVGKRVPLGPIYWAMFALIVLAAVLRIVAMQSRGRQVALASS